MIATCELMQGPGETESTHKVRLLTNATFAARVNARRALPAEVSLFDDSRLCARGIFGTQSRR